MNKCILFLYFLSLFNLTSLKAEYRVFVLEIKNEKLGISKTIKSTLDPDQYKSFYILKNDETISYVDTWKCKGHTGFLKTLCPKTLVQN